MTLLELILAVGEVGWKWLCSWVPVLLVADLLGHMFAVLWFLGRLSLLSANALSLLTVY